MTVSTQVKKVSRPGNGATTVFSFSPIVIFKTTDITVVRTVDSTGVETPLSEGLLNTNYSVSAVASTGQTGSITFPAAGSTGGTVLPTGETLTIKRVLILEQTNDLENQGGYFPDVQETSFDKGIMIDLQQQDSIDAALKLKISDTLGSSVEVARTASLFLRWNAAADGIDAVAVSVVAGAASDVAPLDTTFGSAAAGSAADVSREDHVHAMPSTVARRDALNTFTATQQWLKGADVASAADLDVTIAGNIFTVTGTTNITSMKTKGAGTIMVLSFAGVLTLTHDATNLILPGATNIVTSAGSVAVFYEHAAADWTLISYQDGLGATTPASTVTWLQGADVVSAAALLVNIPGNLFDVTGTTTITSLSTKGIGTVVVLQFDGAVTVTHHATNLILPGATNITTSAGSIMVLYEYGAGTWRMVSYSEGNGDRISVGTDTLLKGADVASAAAPVINIDGNIFDITGTTTITSFPTKGVGTIVTLQFDGALLLTHNATSLILPGGANITTAAGDTLSMYEHSSGNWTISNYERANGGANVITTRGDVIRGSSGNVAERLAIGAADTILTSDGTDAAWASPAVLTLGTAVPDAAQTDIDFTSIPSWVKRITVQFIGISTSGTDDLWVQIGDAGGIEATGYLGGVTRLADAGPVKASRLTTAFCIATTVVATNVVHGTLVLTRENTAAFTWIAVGTLTHSDVDVVQLSSGSKSLSATLDRVRITTTSGTDTFDAGEINILFE